MKVTIRLKYLSWGGEMLRAGSFPVNERLFREDPDKEAVRVTKQWIKEIRREHEIKGITKVIYDGEKDITELVKKHE
jgi:hypothetical protein